MKILNFGSCNIDYVYSVNHFIAPGETLSAEKLNIFPGGKGLNQSVAIARAGGKVYHAGLIGNDGLFLKELLTNEGVDTSLMQITDTKTGHAIIEVTLDGENRILIYSGANSAINEEYVNYVMSHFERDDILVLQNEISCREYIISKADEIGMTIVFNVAPFSSSITNENLSAVTYLAVNETEASGLSDKKNIAEVIPALKKKYPHTKIILTLGSEGCRYIDEATDLYQPAFKVKAVDSTAAGDTFIGYFVAGLAKHDDISKLLEICCKASAICVTRPGASASIPMINDLS